MPRAKETAGLSGFSFGSDSARPDDRARRLTDKILQAFNHAYAVGEVDVAASLRRLLEKRGRSGPSKAEEAGTDDPIRRANLWVMFVDSRNRYRAACEKRKGNARTAAIALEDMKEAYRRWCAG